jgi:hypothetical protein
MTSAVVAEITSIDVGKHMISYIYNNERNQVKYINLGDKTNLAVAQAYEGIVLYNNGRPMIALITLRSEYLEKLKERNSKFQCGIVA